ncbi:MAG: efflux RND transporter periplasmic adaptor subunit [Patescibacteria group bacterium]|nr:efflux RND transporter periplasmic adaptor subunit [Patescibacteria group bacterium]MDD5490580.1 efflux RND transporter periplasmic adaptor subunit [Patescibacteria group bacterium]
MDNIIAGTPGKKKIGAKKIIIVAIAGFLVTAVSVFAFTKTRGPDFEYTTEKVKRGNLTQTVEATGSVKPETDMDLSFKVTGKLFKNHVKVGDKVEAGQILSELDATDALLEVEKARSSLASANANLNLKIIGESRESIKVYEEDVAKAKSNLKKVQTDLDNTKKSNEESVREAELNVAKYETALASAKADLENSKKTDTQEIGNAYEDARTTLLGNLVALSTAMNDMDNILGIDNRGINDDFESLLGILRLQTKINAEDAYKLTATKKETVEPWVGVLDADSSYDEIKIVVSNMKDLLSLASDALSKTRTMLDSTITGTGLTLSSLNTLKTTINTDRSSINTESTSLQTKEQAILTAELNYNKHVDTYTSAVETAEDNLASAEQSLTTAKVDADNAYKAAVNQVEIMRSALAAAEASLAYKKAPPRQADLASLEAQVSEARAALNLAEQNLENTKIKAPAAGVITSVEYEVGEQISLTKPAISMVGNEGELKVEVDISESDISKVKSGNEVKITFDAFGEDRVYSGKVTSVEPAETIIDDVVYYRVNVSIDGGKEEIKPGMTANTDILTARRDNVLCIPGRAIIRQNNEQMVRILEKKEVREIPVQIGLRADEGLVEVLSGLKEGEEVVAYIKEKK